MANNLRGSAVIVGVGHSGMGVAAGDRNALDILGESALVALTEAGLSVRDVDGLFTGSSFHFMPTLSTAEYLGIQPSYFDGSMIGGASFVNYLSSAALALEAGLCNVALICYGSNQRTSVGGLATMSEQQPYEVPYAPRYPISSYALATARHMYEYGTTREQLAEVAVAARRWAQLNPDAFARDDTSIEEVLQSRMVSDPITVRDCCLVTDGGGAIVMVRAERAGEFEKPPIYLLGGSSATRHRQITSMPDLTETAAVESGKRAYAMAGVSPADIDVLGLYDAFTINPILFLEDLGFCKKGEGGAFVAEGRIAPGGELPVNTNGGGLSCCHPGMYGIFPVIEVVRQLRGEAGERQINGANVGLAHGNGGVLSAQVTAILGTAATL